MVTLNDAAARAAHSHRAPTRPPNAAATDANADGALRPGGVEGAANARRPGALPGVANAERPGAVDSFEGAAASTRRPAARMNTVRGEPPMPTAPATPSTATGANIVPVNPTQVTPQQITDAAKKTMGALEKLPPDKRAAAAAQAAAVAGGIAQGLPQAYAAQHVDDPPVPVNAGDNLTTIAAGYVDPATGKPLTAADLRQVNPQLFEAPASSSSSSSPEKRTAGGDLIYVGDAVKMPPGAVPAGEYAQMRSQQAALTQAAQQFAAVAAQS